MRSILLIIALSCFSLAALRAQVSGGGSSMVIDTSVHTQYEPRIKTAENGWIFAGFLTNSDYRLFRSEDGGNTWLKIVDHSTQLSDWDIEVTGGSAKDPNVDVWIATANADTLTISDYNNDVGILIPKKVYTPPQSVICKNVTIATDFKNPGAAANPYSLAVGLTVDGVAEDSLLLFVSNDGGNSWKNNTSYSTVNYLHRISIAYGYSPEDNYGTFFLAGEYNYSKSALDYNQDIYYLWEKEDLSEYSPLGFLDSINNDWASNIGHPDIVVQNSTAQNDLGDLSAIILFSMRMISGGDTAESSVFAGTMSFLKNFTTYKKWSVNRILDVYNNNVSTPARGIYNTLNNNFEFVAGDTVSGALYYYILNFHSIDSTSDTVYTPYKIINSSSLYRINYGDPRCDNSGIFDSTLVADWIGNNDTTGNIYTLFNAKYTPLPAGIVPLAASVKLNLFPNPANQYVTIDISQQHYQNPTIEVCNLLGQVVYETHFSNTNYLKLDVGNWSEGNYFARINDNSNIGVCKFTVAR